MSNPIFGSTLTSTKNVQYFDGISGIKALYRMIISSWKPKDEYFVASAPIESFEKLENFFLNTVHKKRIKDKVVMKIIINKGGESYGFVRKKMPFTQVKFLDTNSKSEYGVLNDLIFIVDYGEKPSAILINNKSSADTLRELFKMLWNAGHKVSIPPLIHSEKDLITLIKSAKSHNPVIVSDEYTHPLVKRIADSFMVKNNSYENIKAIKRKISKNHNRLIIGVGGCTALDAARGAATPKIPFIPLPSILSTVCISIDKSVFNLNGEDHLFQTEAPQKVVLSWPLLLETKQEDLVKWSQSGFGDLFAKMGAAIDVVFREASASREALSLEKVRRKIPETFSAMEWVLRSFNGYTKKNLKTLSLFLHEASVSIILTGGFELSGGGEHDMAYAMNKRHRMGKKVWPTHGQMVSIGTLIELNLFGEITDDYTLYTKMKKAYKKLGLPTDYTSLAKIGIKKSHIAKGIKDIAHLNTFMSHHHKKAIGLLDKVFESEQK